MGDLIGQFFQFLQQLILPNWPDLIALLPWVIDRDRRRCGLFWLALAWMRRRCRNRSRVPKPLAGGAPPPGVHMPGPSRWPFVAPIGAALLLFSFALPPKDAAGNATGPFNLQLFALGLIVSLIAIGGWLWDAMREWRARSSPQLAGAHAHGRCRRVERGHGARACWPTAARSAAAAFGAAAAPPVVEERAYPSRRRACTCRARARGRSSCPIAATVHALRLHLQLGADRRRPDPVPSSRSPAGTSTRGTNTSARRRSGHAVPATRDPYKAWPKRLVPVFVARDRDLARDHAGADRPRLPELAHARRRRRPSRSTVPANARRSPRRASSSTRAISSCRPDGRSS